MELNAAEKMTCTGGARAVLRQLAASGWTQGTTLNEETGTMCVYGAAAFHGLDFPLLAGYLRDVIAELFPDRVTCDCGISTAGLYENQLWHTIAVHFNDNPATTEEDVMLVLKHAAEES